ncbi:sensor histidine kinase [Pedobacter sp. KBW06]|uniref:sensor histidine kinase n=1 Tax=Pedobacter sp. KBW06 TaxID=2153359 RepID=UPI000F59A7D1|nr:histidine kinase [Pedobacter sp. KBW06]RQO74207.1 sensor histidine kinase [Pedobacter sp. KBW06]
MSKSKDLFPRPVNKYLRFITIPAIFLVLNILSYLLNPYSAYYKHYFSRPVLEILTDGALTMIFCGLIFELSVFNSVILDKIIPWTEKPFTRFSIQLLFQIIFVIILMVILYYIGSLIYTYEEKLTFEEELSGLQFVYVCVIMGILISAVTTGNFLLQKWKTTMIEATELKLKTAEFKEIAMQAELQSLKLQLDPHFMFNNFSTLSELISEDQLKAEVFLRNLSRVYRYMIVNLNKNIVSLEEELIFVDAYLYLIRIRYGENVTISVDITNDDGRGIPPITLQLLIENAIKHNAATKTNPLHIKIYNTDAHIVVSNNLQRIKLAIPSARIGLQNIRSRYALLSENLPSIIEDESSFAVYLPLLPL